MKRDDYITYLCVIENGLLDIEDCVGDGDTQGAKKACLQHYKAFAQFVAKTTKGKLGELAKEVLEAENVDYEGTKE